MRSALPTAASKQMKNIFEEAKNAVYRYQRINKPTLNSAGSMLGFFGSPTCRTNTVEVANFFNQTFLQDRQAY